MDLAKQYRHDIKVLFKVRPLFLLKEAYHGRGNWDLISEHLLTDRKIGSGTWRRVSEWRYFKFKHGDYQQVCRIRQGTAA